MKEHPILFSGEMVRAILEGHKTMTRRVVKPQPELVTAQDGFGPMLHIPKKGIFWDGDPNNTCPYGNPSDRLWVRETFCRCNGTDEAKTICYRADDNTCDSAKWTPSIHMPRSASRITLEVTGVKVERLLNISNKDAIAEGVYQTRKNGWLWYDPAETETPHCSHALSPKQAFMWLWDDINTKRPGCSWNNNPWVWAIEFKRVTE